MSWLKSDPTCSACGRSYPKGKSCLRCQNIERGHTKTAKRAGVNPAPRPCPRCGRTMRGGVCPGPDC